MLQAAEQPAVVAYLNWYELPSNGGNCVYQGTPPRMGPYTLRDDGTVWYSGISPGPLTNSAWDITDSVFTLETIEGQFINGAITFVPLELTPHEINGGPVPAFTWGERGAACIETLSFPYLGRFVQRIEITPVGTNVLWHDHDGFAPVEVPYQTGPSLIDPVELDLEVSELVGEEDEDFPQGERPLPTVEFDLAPVWQPISGLTNVSSLPQSMTIDPNGTLSIFVELLKAIEIVFASLYAFWVVFKEFRRA